MDHYKERIMPQGVLAVGEMAGEGLRKVSFEAASEGKRIADALSGGMCALVMGSAPEAAAEALAGYGAEKIFTVADEALSDYRMDAFAGVAAAVIKEVDPAVVIVGASVWGKELGARLSALLDAPLAMDCVALRVDGDQLVATRPVYGGKLMADVKLQGTPQLITVRPNAMSVAKIDGAGEMIAKAAALGNTALTFVEKRLETGRIELTEADVVVTGGRGMSGDDYTVVEALAELLEGAVGASRSAVDEGWRPVSDQVGQTGKTVAPSLYVACGVSGAIQHLAGMRTSKVIVAINKDPDAPIFLKADYGVVGDLFEVVPAITEAVKKLKA
jgi:electron transfer flavoprotein alpha subunit